MDENKNVFENVDEYIALFPEHVQEILSALRKVIREAVPEAQEKISYQMPTFALHGNLVHFAAYKKHIGFYPGASGISAFKEQLAAYKGAKGSVQFPIEQPLPFELITQITKFRAIESKERAAAKLKTKRK